VPTRWCAAANLRKYQIESGLDVTFNDVFVPLFLEKISKLQPKRLLEVGAGTGHLSKILDLHGFAVTAIEPSAGMFAVAQTVLTGTSVQLLHCGSFDLRPGDVYDAAFSHMVAHVVDDLKEFLASVAATLSSGAHFIFSIPHPCFYEQYKNMLGPSYSYMNFIVAVVCLFFSIVGY
jgi:SAM-dependent methyltransferase